MKGEMTVIDESVGKTHHDKDTSLWCHVVVRNDIPIGIQGAQAIHAALESGERFGAPKGLRVALLSVPDADTLINVARTLDDQGIEYVAFHEPDWGIGFSALATKPLRKSESRAFRKIALWRPMGHSP